MELPFAMDSFSGDGRSNNNNNNHLGSSHPSIASSSSLVTASSQGDSSFLQADHDNDNDNDKYEPITHAALHHQHPPDHITLPHAPYTTARSSQQIPKPAVNSSRLSSVLSQFGAAVVSHATTMSAKTAATRPDSRQPTETVDFETYVNVSETDADEVDIILAGGDPGIASNPAAAATMHDATVEQGLITGDILTVLLSGPVVVMDQQHGGGGGDGPHDNGQHDESVVTLCQVANLAATRASQAKRNGHLQEALDAHSQAAKLFRQAALLVGNGSVSMAKSLLLLSQTQAKSALALQRVVKLRPNVLSQIQKSATAGSSKDNDNDTNSSSSVTRSPSTHKERLRATVRGALDNRKEADISDSAFLGRATGGPSQQYNNNNTVTHREVDAQDANNDHSSSSQNPVDEMMELERELREMDMALELGSSLASLDARTQNRMKNSVVADTGSFMVVPPGGANASYMSSSSMWVGVQQQQQHISTPVATAGSPRIPSAGSHAVGSGTAGVRARANRVQNILEASNTRVVPPPPPIPQSLTTSAAASAAVTNNTQLQSNGLESSWWGHSSSASQVLTSSVISLASGIGGGLHHDGAAGSNSAGSGGSNQPANTKQLMRLMDSLKTLGDENAALMRQVEGAEAARIEAKAAREQMKRFKDEYGQRFATLKAALEKFRKSYPENSNSSPQDINPVTNSDFVRATSASDQLLRQEQLIRKLTTDLKKEKEESKKKDTALRKYESFYREVKARSAQKAAQRQKETQQRQQQQPGSRALGVPRIPR